MTGASIGQHELTPPSRGHRRTRLLMTGLTLASCGAMFMYRYTAPAPPGD